MFFGRELPLNRAQSCLQRESPSLLSSALASPGWYSSRQPSILMTWSIATHRLCSQHLPLSRVHPLSVSIASPPASPCAFYIVSLLKKKSLSSRIPTFRETCWQLWLPWLQLQMWTDYLSVAKLAGILFLWAVRRNKEKTIKNEHGVGGATEINKRQEGVEYDFYSLTGRY